MMQRAKEDLRREIMDRLTRDGADFPVEQWGKAAERIRRIQPYKMARTIFASPTRPVRQVRLNILSDRKRLVLPTSGLQKGFLLLEPDSIPPRKRSMAVQVTQGNPFGTKIPYSIRPNPPITLIVTEAIAVGLDGSRMGDGRGHIDLEYAILQTLGWLDPSVQIVAVVDEHQVHPSLPMEDTDTGVHWIATPQRIFRTPYDRLPQAGIRWERLTPKEIRRNDALFHLHHQQPAG